MTRSIELHQRALDAAAAQAGVISHDQLVHLLGWSKGAIRTQLSAHRWQRVFHGVYAVTTGELPMESLWWAAHLRCGDASALTGETALQAWRIQAQRQPTEIVVPYSANARAPGLIVHRTRRPFRRKFPKGLPPIIPPDEAVLMVTNRLDAAEVLDLVSSACQQGRVSTDRLASAMLGVRLKHRRLLVELLEDMNGGATTPLEVAGVRLILKAHGLPTGEGQVREQVNGRVVVRDRVINGLILEFDGRLGHSDPSDRFRDLARDNRAVLTGRPTLRFGWTDVHENACAAADQVAHTLSIMGVAIEMTRCSPACTSKLVASEYDRDINHRR